MYRAMMSITLIALRYIHYSVTFNKPCLSKLKLIDTVTRKTRDVIPVSEASRSTPFNSVRNYFSAVNDRRKNRLRRPTQRREGERLSFYTARKVSINELRQLVVTARNAGTPIVGH